MHITIQLSFIIVHQVIELSAKYTSGYKRVLQNKHVNVKLNCSGHFQVKHFDGSQMWQFNVWGFFYII